MTVTLPAGNPGVGDISVTITSDVANAVAEENASGTAETNNEATFAFQSALAPFIDLSVSGVAVEPASGWAPGDEVTLNWTTTNSGNRPHPAVFSDSKLVRNDSIGTKVLLVTMTYV